MILRLLILVNAWVWGVEPWEPMNCDEWFAVAMSVVVLDAPAMIGIGVLLYCIIEQIKGKKKEGGDDGK